MSFDKIKKALGKPLKFALNMHNLLLLTPFVLLSGVLNIFTEINIILSMIVFSIQLVLGIFITFLITKAYLEFIKVEKGRLKTRNLKEDFREVFLTLLASIVAIYAVVFACAIIVGVVSLLTILISSYFVAISSITGILLAMFITIVLITIPLAFFYLRASIIIGRNKLIYALKESVDLMRYNFLYSFLRILLLIVVDMVVLALFIFLPVMSVIYKIFSLIPEGFNMMSEIAQEAYIMQLFENFLVQNLFTAAIIIFLVFTGSIIINLLNTAFVSNMYLELTSKKKKSAKTAKKK